MIYNKKGLSEVVTTVIFVSLALIAIGIVWAVINGLVQRGAGDVATTEKCLKINVEPTAASCTVNTCLVTLNRKAGGDAIAGVKLVFKDATGASGTINTSIGNIEPLVTVVKEARTGLAGKTPASVEVSAYLTDTEGKEAVCTKASSFAISNIIAGCVSNVDCPSGKPCILATNTCTP